MSEMCRQEAILGTLHCCIISKKSRMGKMGVLLFLSQKEEDRGSPDEGQRFSPCFAGSKRSIG